MTPAPRSAPRPLPALRGELMLSRREGRSRSRGNALIIDPLARRYIAVDEDTHTLLALWSSCKTEEELIAVAWAKHSIAASAEDIAALRKFLDSNKLIADGSETDWKALAENERKSRPSWLAWLIHNYLFIRVPLLRPQKFLQATVSLVEPLYSRTFFRLVLVLGLLGLYFVSRQWSQFVSTFSDFASLEGIVILALSLVFVKTLHELGHAYTAVRYGCKVPAMGICFMVMVPMLYTDVTDVWTLGSRRKRLAVDGAGVIVELILACAATCLWAFLPDGPMRAVVFAIATTGWLSSLALNLNPFMRFDGYYLLSDFLEIENLQPRSFEMGCWHLREFIFAIGRPPPERFAPRLQRGLIAYAYMVWLYRFVLFTGIAVLVYMMTFKILGLVLFAIEIVYFIAWPIWAECKEWYAMRNIILQTRRTQISGAVLSGVALLALVPWRTTIAVPATIEPASIRDVFPMRGGMIVRASVGFGQSIAAGDTLLVLKSSELEKTIERALRELELVRLRLLRRPADETDRAQSLVLEDEQRSLMAKLEGLERERMELTIKAPISGIVQEVNPDIHVGREISRGEPIAILAGKSGVVVRGFLSEDDLKRLSATATGTFVPESIFEPNVDVLLRDVALSSAPEIPAGELTSFYGGAIPVRDVRQSNDRRALVPIRAHYLVMADASANAVSQTVRRSRGTLLVKGRAESLAARAARQVLAVLIRESGF